MKKLERINFEILRKNFSQLNQNDAGGASNLPPEFPAFLFYGGG